MQSNLFEAYASNPRYAEGGLDAEIEREELEAARKIDSEQVALNSLANIESPAPSMDPKMETIDNESQAINQASKQSSNEDQTRQTYEKVLGVVDNATRIPRDIVGGATKAINNTMALVVGRENYDAANEWLSKEMPGLVEFTSDFEKGYAADGMVSEITQEISQFALPFTAYMKGVTALSIASNAKAGTFTSALVADIITAGTALDPHVERLSALAKEYGIENKVIGWLADNENETESEGRFKNILEATGLGVGAAAALAAVALPLKGLWRLSKTPKKPPVPEIPPEIKPVDMLMSDDMVGEIEDVIKGLPKETPKSKNIFPRENLNDDLLVDEKVMVDGVEEVIQRPAGDMLKDMDSLVDTLEDILKDL